MKIIKNKMEEREREMGRGRERERGGEEEGEGYHEVIHNDNDCCSQLDVR